MSFPSLRARHERIATNLKQIEMRIAFFGSPLRQITLLPSLDENGRPLKVLRFPEGAPSPAAETYSGEVVRSNRRLHPPKW